MTIRKKTLIIKTGHSETFCTEVDLHPSLGDVLRTTVLLNSSLDEEFYWLVSPEALNLIPLAKDQIFLWNEEGKVAAAHLNFDRVINLEKGKEVRDYLSLLDASEFLGFIESEDILSTPLGLKPLNSFTRTPWQKGLYQILSHDWTDEEYVLRLSTHPPSYDVGINWQVGEKWKNKNLSLDTWKRLEKKLASRGYKVSWQEGLSDIEDYIAWVDSNRLLLTLDSLGLHIGLALKKKVIALFGPTSSHEIHLYNRGDALVNSQKECLPCQRRFCLQEENCMQGIDEDMIVERVVAHLGAVHDLQA